MHVFAGRSQPRSRNREKAGHGRYPFNLRPSAHLIAGGKLWFAVPTTSTSAMPACCVPMCSCEYYEASVLCRSRAAVSSKFPLTLSPSFFDVYLRGAPSPSSTIGLTIQKCNPRTERIDCAFGCGAVLQNEKGRALAPAPCCVCLTSDLDLRPAPFQLMRRSHLPVLHLCYQRLVSPVLNQS